MSLRWRFEDRAVRADDDHGVVERAAAEVRVALVDAADHGDLVALRRFAQRREVVARQVDRVARSSACSFSVSAISPPGRSRQIHAG